MKYFTCLAIMMMLISCNTSVEIEQPGGAMLPIQGSWKLITGFTIEKNDTIITDYTTGRSFIKLISQTHFAFMGHDLSKGKDSNAFYISGGGKYELVDSMYTEHLEYCSDRQWENNDFHFTVSITNDTLVQQGIEKVPDAGIDRLNIEKYVRIKN